MSILTKPAKELFEKNILNRKLHKQVGKQLLSEWNIPLNISNDLLTLRKGAATANDYVLYHLISAIDKSALPKGYPPEHLLNELNKKYNDEKVKLPLSYQMIQIQDDQWIGKITGKELYNLGNSGLINYNENAQRVMKPVILPTGEVFEISLNESAVDHIQESLEESRYIPNTITLNIPYNDSSSFVYDEKSNKLTIKKVKMLDILDGYHRYVALNRICSLDTEFDCVMELRITYFSDEKARQFIWQEDQKTKMSKVESESLNKYNAANMIVKKMQDSIYGSIISYNKGIISSSTLSQAISVAYNINPYRTYKISEIDSISKEIIYGFEKMSESNPHIFDETLSSMEIYCLITAIKTESYDIKFDRICGYMDGILSSSRRTFNKSVFNKIVEAMKGGV